MKAFFLLFLLIFSFSGFSQSTEDIINNITGDMEESLNIVEKANYAEITGIATAAIPLVLFPISLYVADPHKRNLQISYYTFSVASLSLFLSGFILSEIHKVKARKKLDQLYQYKKIISGNYEIEEKEFIYETND